MSVLNFLERQSTKVEFIKFVEQYCDINGIINIANINNTHKYVIAGGAVNAFVMHKLHGINCPVNDIDIFKCMATFNYMPNNPMPVRSKIESALSDGGYNHVISAGINKNQYMVVSTNRDGMVNIINAVFSKSSLSKDNALSIPYALLDGFDINCCQIGFDIGSFQFIYTPSYEQFVNDMQIKTTILVTPWHTLFRLPQKQLDIPGSYLNLNVEKQLIASYVDSLDVRINDIRRWNAAGMGDASVQCVELSFGKIYKKKFDKVEHLLGDEISLVEEGDGLWTIANSANYEKVVHAGNVTTPDEYLKLFRLAYDITAPKTQRRVAKETIAACGIGDMFVFHKTITVDKFIHHDTVHYIDKVNAFFSQHNLSSIFHYCKTLASVMIGINYLKDLEEEYGSMIYGVIETQCCNVDITTPYGKYVIEKCIKEEFNSGDIQLCTPFYLEGFSYNVKQLFTKNELVAEGDYMKHCVGGYANAVRIGRSLIFSIKDSHDNRSTVEYGIGDNKYILIQNRAKCNAMPTEECQHIARELLECINSIYCPIKTVSSAPLAELDV